MNLKEAEEAIAVIKKIYGDLEEWWRGLSPFEILVSTIISQNTNSRNTAIAFKRLKENVNVTPEGLLEASLEELEECLKPAGLYRVKARRLKEVSSLLLSKGGLEAILRKPLEEAREELTSLPGVGWKTADVVLSFAVGRATFPVDTHIARIARRWGIVGEKAVYEEVSNTFKKIVSEGERRRVHLMLIRFGREYCTARAPKCSRCPVRPPCKGVAQEEKTAR